MYGGRGLWWINSISPRPERDRTILRMSSSGLGAPHKQEKPMKRKAVIVLLCVFCLSLLACEYEYVTHTLEATQIPFWESSMRTDGWRIVKKEKVGERVYEYRKSDYENPWDKVFPPSKEQKQDVVILYAVTFRRPVR